MFAFTAGVDAHMTAQSTGSMFFLRGRCDCMRLCPQAMVRAKVPAGVDMNVNVLTSGYWPSYPIIEATLPQELSGYSQVFKDFYLAKHSGRKLVWQNSLGTCVLRARFSKGVKELSVSMFQVNSLGLLHKSWA